jgi:uncharacterized protein (DUF302 family)
LPRGGSLYDDTRLSPAARHRLVCTAQLYSGKGSQLNTAEGSQNGLVRVACKGSVSEAAERLEAALRAKGVIVFARIDFSADAKKAGLTMRPEVLIIFGSPKAGTPLMVAAPSVGIDLPLKVLLWEESDGRAWLAYNEPAYIIKRHQLDLGLAANLAGLIPLIESSARG